MTAGTIIIYLLKSIIISGILLGCYLAILRDRQFHRFNRFYLLASIVASIIMPAMNYHLALPVKSISPEKTLTLFRGPHHNDSALQVLVYIVCTISIVFLLSLLLKILQVYRLKRHSTIIRKGPINLILTDVQSAPFSFFQNLFWRNDISFSDESASRILRHEIEHIRQGHSYDKMFTQIALSCMWMNPFFWMIERELTLVHEYLADQATIKRGDGHAFALMVLSCNSAGKKFNFTNALFHSSIERRLRMIFYKTDSVPSIGRRLAAFLLLLSVSILTAISSTVVKTDPQIGGAVDIKYTTIEKRSDSLASVTVRYVDASGKEKVMRLENVKVGEPTDPSLRVNK